MGIHSKETLRGSIMQQSSIVALTRLAPAPAAPTKNIAELAIATPQLSTLLAAVKAAGLVDTLASEGPFTVFAPTNEAFDRVPSSTLTALLTDKEALTAVLLRHVLPETIFQKGICWETHQTAGGDEIATQVYK